MSFLRSARSSSASAIPSYTGLQVQTSSNSVPIQIMWGVNKIAPNIVWTGGFQSTPQYTKKAGKGGGGKTLSGYDYRAAFILGICEGPVYSVEKVWQGKGETDLSWLGLGLMYGATPQAPWGYVAAAYPAEALPYGGLAYAAAPAFDLGSSATLPPLAFEVYGQLSFHSGVTFFDSDPALIIQDLLTNPQYGVGFPAASINATSLLGSSGGSSYQAYCKAAGIALSPVLSNQESANSILTRWLQLTNAAAVWSGGQLKFIPYGDATIVGALVPSGSSSFAPNVTPIYSLTDDDYIVVGDQDPVEVTRADPYDAKNWVSIEILQRSNHYDATPVEAWDQNHIESFGLHKAQSITAHEICDVSVAQRVAQLTLQRGLYVRNTFTFKLSFEYCLLEPMDLVELNDAALGLNNAVVRIIAIEEDDAGTLTITAEEYPAGAATAVAYPVESGASSPPDRNVAPAAVNPPIIFEPPAVLTGGKAEVWIALSGGTDGTRDPNWGGAIVYVSMDNVTYGQIGEISGAARQGVTSAALSAQAGSNPDTSNILAVDMSRSGAPLVSVSEADAASAITLCIVDNELLSYASASLTDANKYALSYLERGLYGSAPSAHPAMAAFARLDDAIFKYQIPDAYVGANVYLKFQSFNIFGEQAEDLSTCAVYTYRSRGSGLFGSVARTMSVGADLDFGLASSGVNESDDFGMASDPYVTIIDLGLASE
ncbi:conserved hypothetical protein, putative phage associated protein [Methylocella silvestris BL2]|uniref:Uncharacterized protein n=1 Tax=Methylocella silvestris (strain DSM 15510 / CIP 108128 / LMG 27833 / NCIMB 13906 / BL2) TaxID=395965 RepID=B8EKU0_METSB|nr:phage tail protein [Methylocella silvestris]ACK51968.1 conserved hypothetical protein, putative phage associated protein [Methylocella silvestris BL2]